MVDSIEGVGVIMIRCVFIQINETMLKIKEEFIHTHKMVFAIDIRFRHPNFDIKGGIVHLIFLFFIIVMLQKFVPIFW
jgi:hypothetical protein